MARAKGHTISLCEAEDVHSYKLLAGRACQAQFDLLVTVSRCWTTKTMLDNEGKMFEFLHLYSLDR